MAPPVLLKRREVLIGQPDLPTQNRKRIARMQILHQIVHAGEALASTGLKFRHRFAPGRIWNFDFEGHLPSSFNLELIRCGETPHLKRCRQRRHGMLQQTPAG